MKAATNNFNWSLLIGQGAFGSVYDGKINGGKTIVAIKHRNSDSSRGERDFLTVIGMSSKHLRYNVLPLVSYCDAMGEMILVYNYMTLAEDAKYYISEYLEHPRLHEFITSFYKLPSRICSSQLS